VVVVAAEGFEELEPGGVAGEVEQAVEGVLDVPDIAAAAGDNGSTTGVYWVTASFCSPCISLAMVLTDWNNAS
jgi:hypothetical protein